MNKKISIVMPTFNAELYINESLESISIQKNIEYEVIIVDGGSTDSTLNIIKTQKFLKNIKIISESDDGAYDALNKGFSSASGDIYCWLNADDVYVTPFALQEACLALADEHTEFAYGHSVTIDSAGIVSKTLLSWQTNSKYLYLGANIFTGSLFFKSNAWKDFGNFSKKYNIAFECQLIQFLMNRSNPVLINHCIAALRIHPDTLTNRYADVIQRQMDDLWPIRRQNINLFGEIQSKVNRILSTYKNRTFFKTLLNKFFDFNAGKSWRVMAGVGKSSLHNSQEQ